ncbi:MAG: MFS transporter [Lachnospirales bacterium]
MAFDWVLGLVILIWRSTTLENPIINLSILKNLKLTGHIIAFFSFQLGSLAMSFLLPNYVQLVNNSNTTLAALMLLPGAIIGAGFAPFSGIILDKMGARKPILIGASLIVLAQLLFSLFGLSLSNTLILAFYMIFMTGLGVAFGNVMTNGQKQLSLDQRADANAIFNTLQQFAGAVGTTLASLIVAMSQANHKIDFARATAQGSRNGFGSYLFWLFSNSLSYLVLLKRMINNKFEAKETCFPLLFLSLIEILILLQILVLC